MGFFGLTVLRNLLLAVGKAVLGAIGICIGPPQLKAELG